MYWSLLVFHHQLNHESYLQSMAYLNHHFFIESSCFIISPMNPSIKHLLNIYFVARFTIPQTPEKTTCARLLRCILRRLRPDGPRGILAEALHAVLLAPLLHGLQETWRFQMDIPGSNGATVPLNEPFLMGKKWVNQLSDYLGHFQ